MAGKLMLGESYFMRERKNDMKTLDMDFGMLWLKHFTLAVSLGPDLTGPSWGLDVGREIVHFN